MLSNRFKNRLEMTATQGNVLMAQIRAEKKNYNNTSQVPLLLGSHRQQQGKRIFKDILFRPSLSPTHGEQKQNYQKNSSPFRGKRIIGETFNISQEHSLSGKKMFNKKVKNIQSDHKFQRQQPKSGKRRFDHSPTHQHLNATLNLAWH